MKKEFDEKDDNAVIEIFAHLSNKQFALIQNEDVEVEIPNNTEMTNRAGSKSLYFTCYGKQSAKELVDGLDASSVPWQEVYAGGNGEELFDNSDGKVDKNKTRYGDET